MSLHEHHHVPWRKSGASQIHSENFMGSKCVNLPKGKQFKVPEPREFYFEILI